MKNVSCLLLSLFALTAAQAQTDRVGVGTSSPRAGLDVRHNDGIIATGTRLQGFPDLPSGEGPRLLWVPGRSAFRAGYALRTEWDLPNIGPNSVALGYNNTASGGASTSIGQDNTASGDNAIAIGLRNTADALASTALSAYVSTNGKQGSFVIGDYSNDTPITSSDNHEFSARFSGDYRLYTNRDMTIGARLVSDQTAWSTLSDSAKKEGFRLADGALFLQKIAGMRLGSWNYRGQDARTMRHYGPMAQDFFSAFGHDSVGTIGCDTLINQADFDGVNLIAIQALVRENLRLMREAADLRCLLNGLAADLRALKTFTSQPMVAR